MTSNNTKKYELKEKELRLELDELKNSVSYIWFNLTVKLISFGKIDLTNIKQNKIDKLSNEVQEFSKIFKKIEDIELILNEFNNSIDDSYINDTKRNYYNSKLKKILLDFPFYDLSIEEDKFPFLSEFFIDSIKTIKIRNRDFIINEKKVFNKFFQTVEDNPLTESQQNAVLTNENNNLVIAGAGSGKTSVIVAKIGYLVKKKLAKADEVLILAFNKKAVEEIKKRISNKLNIETNVSTFHSYGLNIIGEANKKPDICSWASDDIELNRLIREIIKSKLNDTSFLKIFKKYFLENFIPYKNEFDFENKNEYYDYIKSYDLRTLNGDRVKSYEELEIANFLTLKNINYKYEEQYKHDTATSKYRQYKPDFYLTDYDIYIEHFGISRDNKTAPYIDNEKYLTGMQWKKDIHHKYNTQLVETYSFEKSEGNLLTLLEKKLQAYNVKFKDMAFEKVLEIFNKKHGPVDRFTKLTIQFLNHFKSNNYTIDTILKRIKLSDFRAKAFIEIFEYIYEEYEFKKKQSKGIDFYDMINDAIDIVNKDLYIHKYKYILIDEFQDISSSRSNLIKALCKKINNPILTVVGDDWQSINRFAGSDISIIKNFSNHFGKSETIFLDDSFRFDNNISQVASSFITKNPSQINKTVKAFKTSNSPSIYIYRSTKDEEDNIIKILDFLDEKTNKKKEILLLGRFKHLKPQNLKEIQDSFKHKFDIKYMTVHGSKGLAADFVILLGANKGKFGFPCQVEDDPILNIVMSQQENFYLSEERRLFYVALTRAKETVFIVSNLSNSSIFIDEIVNDNTDKEIQFLNEKDYVVKYCFECKGILVERKSKKGAFYGCSNFPICSHTQSI